MPIVTVQANLFFSGAADHDLTADDELAIRQGVLDQLTTVSGLTIDNIRIVGTERVEVRKLMAAVHATAFKVKVIVEIVMPVIDFPTYASDPSVLTTKVSDLITDSVASDALRASVNSLISSTTVFSSGSTNVEVEIVIEVQYPPTFAPTWSPSNFKMDQGQVAGISVALVFGLLLFAAVMYKVLVNIRTGYGLPAPAGASPESEEVARTQSVDLSMADIFESKEAVVGPESVIIHVAPKPHAEEPETSTAVVESTNESQI